MGVFIAMTKSREMISGLLDSHMGRSTSLSRHRSNSCMKRWRPSEEKDTAVEDAYSNFASSST
jgi:hypothetical protein